MLGSMLRGAVSRDGREVEAEVDAAGTLPLPEDVGRVSDGGTGCFLTTTSSSSAWLKSSVVASSSSPGLSPEESTPSLLSSG
jgi:hypothetical protein